MDTSVYQIPRILHVYKINNQVLIYVFAGVFAAVSLSMEYLIRLLLLQYYTISNLIRLVDRK